MSPRRRQLGETYTPAFDHAGGGYLDFTLRPSVDEATTASSPAAIAAAAAAVSPAAIAAAAQPDQLKKFLLDNETAIVLGAGLIVLLVLLKK